LNPCGQRYRLPGDQHGHDSCLAAARRHFHGETKKCRIGFLIGFGDLIQESLRRGALQSDFGQPDDRLDGFELAEEWTGANEFMKAPMFEEPLRHPGYTPVGGLRSARHPSR